MAKEILINKLFAGKYLSMGENVGHEIINLFEADDGHFYLYVTHTGVVKPYHDDVEAVIFIKHKSDRVAEIVSLAKGIKRVDFSKTNLEDIKYGGATLSQIFKGNKWEQEEDDYTNVTYEADQVVFPEVADGETLMLSLDDEGAGNQNVVRLSAGNRKKIVGQSLRWFTSEKDNPEAYLQLSKLIDVDDGNNRWKPDNSPTLLEASQEPDAKKTSFLEVIGKENDELVFSNLLAYYFDTSFAPFAHDVLGIKNMDAEYSVKREHNHIDIFIESKHYAIVIENKIGSDINGRKKNGMTQLETYKEKTEEETKAENIKCYLFYPDYRDSDLRAEAEARGYIPVRYSEIYRFFLKNASKYNKDEYFAIFLRGLELHSVSTTAEHTLNTMRTRFLGRIKRAMQ